MHACMFVRTYACMYVCMYVCICMYARQYVCMYGCMDICSLFNVTPLRLKKTRVPKKKAKYKVAIKGYFIKGCGADGAAWCSAFSHFAERMG